MRLKQILIGFASSGPTRLAPEIFKPSRRQFRVSHRMLDVLVSEVILQRAGIVTGVRQRVATGMTEHVRVYLKGQAGFLPGTLDRPVKRISCEGTASLRHKDKRRFRCLTVQSAQRAKLIAADRMRRWLAILCPADMQRSGPEIYLGPFQIADLRGPQAVPIGDQNHRSISVTVVIVLCGLDQLLNLSLGQMVARPIGSIGLAHWQSCLQGKRHDDCECPVSHVVAR
jgi:hypothetical protein